MHQLMICTAIAIASATISVLAADSKPDYKLKGISAVKYFTIVEQVLGEKARCKVDFKSLETSIDFVANQSTKLKFVPSSNYSDEMDKRDAKAKQLGDRSHELYKGPHMDEAANSAYKAAEVARDAAQLEADKFSSMPSFFLNIATADVGIGCFAVVDVEVNAVVSHTKILATGQGLFFPSVEIWSKTYYLQGQYK